ncbi:MAG: hypothetical protein R8G66_06025 [Cytophagales bacterium]|nr:hypothetical protein [Cytophagales bacterium]
MRNLKSTRFIRGHSPQEDNSDSSAAVVRKFTEIITLSESFEILSVIDRQLVIGGNITGMVNRHDTILINGSTDAINDQNNTVWEATLEASNTRLTLSNSNLQDNLVDNGYLYLAKEVIIQHDLDAQGVVISLHSIDTGVSIPISYQIIDINNLKLVPDLPLIKEFLAVVVG